MKKNKMMRLASILLVLVLLTTSVISGTFAKYTTTDSASDTAKVAKWGVTALVSGNLFGENYHANSTTETADEIAAAAQQSVDSNNRDNIVAPGTKSDEGLKLSVSGTPEVANTITVDPVYKNGADTFETIFLGEGTYATLVLAKGVTADNYTNYYILDSADDSYALATENDTYNATNKYYELHDVVTVGATYYPIVYTWTEHGEQSDTSVTYTDAINGTDSLYADISTYFATSNNPNVDISKSGTLTWAWAFGDTTKVGDTAAFADKADTILGNLMAKAADQVVVKKDATGDTYSVPLDKDDYCLDIDFGVKITITQVD